MVVVISKEDVPPISRTIAAIDRMENYAQTNFVREIDQWWIEVRNLAQLLCRQMGAYDTGTLHDTIRIVFGPVTISGYGAFYEVTAAPSVIQVDRMLVAGGMLINPKTGRICDYAEVVHDGYLLEGRPARPFLTMALDMKEGQLRVIMNKFMNRLEREWARE